MVDFLYKYSDRQSPPLISNKAKFYTTCHALNKGSQALQRKSGAISDGKVHEGGKLHFFASKDEILNSDLMRPKKNDIHWTVTLDNGEQFGNTIKMQNNKAYYYINHVINRKKSLNQMINPSNISQTSSSERKNFRNILTKFPNGNTIRA